MKNSAKTNLLIGVVFLVVGITMLMSGSVSKVMAYGDLAIACAFFALAAKARQ